MLRLYYHFRVFYRDYRELQVAEDNNLQHNNEEQSVKHNYYTQSQEPARKVVGLHKATKSNIIKTFEHFLWAILTQYWPKIKYKVQLNEGDDF